MSGTRRLGRWLLFTALAIVVAVAVAVLAVVAEHLPAVGARAQGARLARMKRSPNFREDRFQDVLPRVEPELIETARRWFGDDNEHRAPTRPVAVVTRKGGDFASPPAGGLRVTWLGHSTLLVELDGAVLLIDPIWGQYAAPIAYESVRRFYPPALPLSDLPELDAVLISHDHYDHLDHPTILQLAATDVPFYVPLGVGAHLERWGIPNGRIHELDRWDQKRLGALRLVATPARHFSGRSLLMTDRDHTLWLGWAMLGPEHRAFYSGDTAMFPGFDEIGRRLGPFDVTMIESGAYSQLWADVHLGPEQAVEAHRMVRGDLMIPVHWGLFDLALHGWTEPIERVLAAADALGVRVASPRPGQSVEPASPPKRERWWPDLPWETAEQAPVISSHL